MEEGGKTGGRKERGNKRRRKDIPSLWADIVQPLKMEIASILLQLGAWLYGLWLDNRQWSLTSNHLHVFKSNAIFIHYPVPGQAHGQKELARCRQNVRLLKEQPKRKLSGTKKSFVAKSEWHQFPVFARPGVAPRPGRLWSICDIHKRTTLLRENTVADYRSLTHRVHDEQLTAISQWLVNSESGLAENKNPFPLP